MISAIRGELLRINQDSVIIRTERFSYELLVPPIVRSKLEGREGEDIELLTLHFIEGSATGGILRPRLIGFLEPVEKGFFEALSTVGGFGPRKALGAMTIPIEEIASAIESGDIRVLSRLPRVGDRTARRLIAELRGKLLQFALHHTESTERVSPEFYSAAKQALLQLGFSQTEAEELIRKAIKARPSISSPDELLEESLRQHSQS